MVSNGRIVGGNEVSPYSIPWQVGIAIPGFLRPMCGGTLISTKHVLSAAHCYDSTQPGSISEFEVIVGEHRINSRADGTRHEVCGHTPHPEYHWKWKQIRINPWENLQEIMVYYNDFEMIRMKVPVTIGIRAVPACLPPQRIINNIRDGDTLTVSGWGRLKDGAAAPDVLHSVDVPFITQRRCIERSYITQQLHENGGLTYAMMCAGHVDGGIDACQGDSGGIKNCYN